MLKLTLLLLVSVYGPASGNDDESSARKVVLERLKTLNVSGPVKFDA